jgi:UDP-glucuronate 4-epimerase
MSRDFTYIDDIIAGIEILLKNPPVKETGNAAYKISNIGNGSPQPLGDFIQAIEAGFGVEAKKEYLPMQAGDVPQTWADVSEMEKLGYKSLTEIKEGTLKFVEWIKTYHS